MDRRRRRARGNPALIALATALLLQAAAAPAADPHATETARAAAHEQGTAALAPSLPEALARLEAARLAIGKRDCAPALALGDPPAAFPPVARQMQQEIRLTCLSQAGRKAEADKLYPLVMQGTLLQPRLALYPVFRAVEDKDPRKAADGIEGLAAKQSPALADLPTPLWRFVGSSLTALGDGARRDRLSLALARIVWQPSDGTDVRDALAAGAIRALVRDGRADEAAPFVDQLEAPDDLAGFATMRRYAALWPALEARLGPASASAIDRFAGSRLEAFARQPQEPSIRQDATGAFLLLNRPRDAAATAAAVEPGADIRDEDMRTALLGVRGLQLAGDTEGAIARLRALAAPGNGNTAPAAILLATSLSDAGRHAEALALSRGLIAQPQAFTGWGLAQVRANESCALAGLNRRAEAAAVAAALADGKLETAPSAIEAHLCLGDTARATALLRTALADEDGPLLLTDDLQPAGAQLPAPTGARAKLWSDFAARPEVQRAAAATIRPLPRPLWPARTERPLPRAGGGGTS